MKEEKEVSVITMPSDEDTKEALNHGILRMLEHANILAAAMDVLEPNEMSDLTTRILMSRKLDEVDRRYIEMLFRRQADFNPVRDAKYLLGALVVLAPELFKEAPIEVETVTLN